MSHSVESVASEVKMYSAAPIKSQIILREGPIESRRYLKGGGGPKNCIGRLNFQL